MTRPRSINSPSGASKSPPTGRTRARPPNSCRVGESAPTGLGLDELLTNADGVSAISMADFAVALLDAAEWPAHRQIRFTVVSM
ncbi:hypothetical protein [Nocardia sp. NPDC050412]|uniref:hypothetical protein n=1 Tax=Nocardia sp. NPDC050412 TaxID=3364320 RepID=UPI0037A9C1C3